MQKKNKTEICKCLVLPFWEYKRAFFITDCKSSGGMLNKIFNKLCVDHCLDLRLSTNLKLKRKTNQHNVLYRNWILLLMSLNPLINRTLSHNYMSLLHVRPCLLSPTSQKISHFSSISLSKHKTGFCIFKHCTLIMF